MGRKPIKSVETANVIFLNAKKKEDLNQGVTLAKSVSIENFSDVWVKEFFNGCLIREGRRRF